MSARLPSLFRALPRSYIRSRYAVPVLAVRRYAEEAAQLKLTFVSPHQVIHSNRAVELVTVPSQDGDFGIMAQHVPVVTPLRPGVITIDVVRGEKEEKYFVSGGYVLVHEDSHCTISAPEAVPVDQLDLDAIRSNLSKYQQEAAAATDEIERVKAQIALEVYEAAQAAATQ
jgi:F-type H+-transporting ATPase subunit delta